MAIKPNFRMATKKAKEILKLLGNPTPPMPLVNLIIDKKWRLLYKDLGGPDGYALKVMIENEFRYVICIAADMKMKYSEEIKSKRQYYTIGHEIGHILLHSEFVVDTCEHPSELTEIQQNNMEVEAHWFASHLLMPDYIFKDISDMDPDKLAAKCGVNLTAANKRIQYLDNKIKKRLIQDASNFYTWPLDHEEIEEANYEGFGQAVLEEYDPLFWQDFEEVAAGDEEED